MKNFSEWFIKQANGTKITLLLLPIIIIAVAVISLTNLVSSNSTPLPTPEPIETNVSTPTPTPIPTIPGISEEDQEEVISDTGGIFYFPYGTESLNNAYSVAEQGGYEQCRIIEGETADAKAARLAPYFTNPQDVAMLDTIVTATEILSRQCDLGTVTTSRGVVDNIPTIYLNASYLAYYINIEQKAKPPADRDILRKRITYRYELKLQSDNSWKITGV